MRARIYAFIPPSNGHHRENARAVVGAIQRDLRRPMASWRARELAPPPSPTNTVRRFLTDNWAFLLAVGVVVAAVSTWTLLGALESWR